MKELYQILRQTLLPVAYLQFQKQVTPPYIIYMDSWEEQRGSDSCNHVKHTAFTVELYTKNRDLQTERLVDEALSFTEFTKNVVYIQSENMYQTIYEFELTKKM